MCKKQKQKIASALNLNPMEGEEEENFQSQSSSSDIVEGSSNDTTSDSEDMPELEDVANQANDQPSANSLGQAACELMNRGGHQTRGEKKARRLIMKMNLKPIENVKRITVRKNKNIVFYIENPEVYKSPHNNCVICFGVLLMGDISKSSTKQTAERAAQPSNFTIQSMQGDKPSVPVGSVQIVSEEAEGVNEGDAAGIDEKDIELVQMQCACSRNKAIKALQSNDNDVVNAIMALTVG